MKKYIAITVISLSVITIGLIAQGRGTPSTLRVRTDSSHALVTTVEAQTPPYTTTIFNNSN